MPSKCKLIPPLAFSRVSPWTSLDAVSGGLGFEDLHRVEAALSLVRADDSLTGKFLQIREMMASEGKGGINEIFLAVL